MTARTHAAEVSPAGSPWRGLVQGRLGALREGHLTVREAGGAADFGRPAADGLSAELTVQHPRFWRRVALGGSLGAAEAYLDGDWETPDLTAVVRLLARNADTLEALEGGLARLRQPVEALLHALRRNTRAGSRRNISAHYDLGDDFFERMLDPTLTYSCGIFERPESTLEEASLAKIDRLCRMLRLGPDDHLLEIGSGWGAFAIRAARTTGCRVTTTTISRNQLQAVRRRVAEAGLQDRITVLHADYRDLAGQYDKLVSVEMLEAVGADYYQPFFRACGSLLRDQGLAAIQVITIADRFYPGHLRSPDFIKRYVFPGSNIPSLSALLDAAARASDLTLRHMEDIGPHYARTLAAWRHNLAASPAPAPRYADRRFQRVWHYYLCYCEAAFAERYLGDAQLLFARPGART
ncbi:MAG: class I SAM-dependent methyltransferase [Deltaproteobacteria bacterium]|nr:class I SAM-dependent methyltransferase [Deltaproteobacteria bacterium]